MEIDEFYVNAGGKGNKKENSRKRGLKRKGRGTYKSERPPTITPYDRTNKRVFTSVEKNLSKIKIGKMINEVNCDGLIINTDEYTIYEDLESHTKVFKHLTVNHASKEYSNGVSHVNNCECFHSIIKPYSLILNYDYLIFRVFVWVTLFITIYILNLTNTNKYAPYTSGNLK